MIDVEVIGRKIPEMKIHLFSFSWDKKPQLQMKSADKMAIYFL